jgi:hypothetical protein
LRPTATSAAAPAMAMTRRSRLLGSIPEPRWVQGSRRFWSRGRPRAARRGEGFPSGGVGGERDKRTVAAAELETQRAEVTKICEIWPVVSAWTAGFGGNFCTRSRFMKIDVISLSTRN